MAPPPRSAAPRELRWDVPDALGLWARAEIPANAATAQGIPGAASGGLRVTWTPCDDEGWFTCEGLRLATRPQFRSVANVPTADGGSGPALALSFAQDAELALRPGLVLRAGADITDQVGLATPLAPGSDTPVAKARAGATVDLRALGAGLPIRLGLSVAVARSLEERAGQQQDDCQGAIEIRYADYVPLRVTAPCTPGRRDSWIGFGLRGQF